MIKMKEVRMVKKVKLVPIGETKEERNEVYKFIRDSQYAQYQGLNKAMSVLTNAYLVSGGDIKSDTFKEAQKSLKGSNPIFNGIEFGRGIDSKSAITQRVKKDFSTSLKNGLARGERTFTNYKRTYPLLTRGRDLKFSYDNDDVIVKWVNKKSFKVITGSNPTRNMELKHTLHNIINGSYKVGESSLEFDRNNNLILNINISFTKETTEEFVEDRTLGVDLGIAIPAYVCLSDNTYVRQGLGSVDDFLKVRMQTKKRRQQLQKSLTMTKGGKGRQKKLKAMEQFKEKERNFVKTYNHQLSHKIVKFAKDNQCQYINLEKLTKEGFSNSLLGSWSYYELQQMIQYKADREGIKVRFINPAYTSQTCSKCGHVDKENRKTQAQFECVKCGFKLNADHNASINIAKSKEFVK